MDPLYFFNLAREKEGGGGGLYYALHTMQLCLILEAVLYSIGIQTFKLVSIIIGFADYIGRDICVATHVFDRPYSMPED